MVTRAARSREGFSGIRALLSARGGSAFKRNFVLALRANLIGQGVALAVTPFLSRLYTPAEFGVLAIFMSITAPILALATCRFDWCVPNARSNAAAAALMVLGFCVLGGALVLTLAGVTAVRLLGGRLDELGPLVYFIPIAVLAGGASAMFQGWFIRTNDLAIVSRVKLYQSLTNVLLSLGGGLAGLGGLGLVGANAGSSGVGVVALARNATVFWRSVRYLNPARIKIVFRRYRGEASWSAVVGLVNVVSFSSVVFAVSAVYSLEEAGWYALMNALAVAPIGLISTAVGQSFWANAAQLARARRFGDLRIHYLKTTRRLSFLAIIVVVGCAAGSVLVGPLLGEAQWGGAGYVLLAMAPMLAGSVMFSPTNHLVVLERQVVQLVGDGVRLLLVVSAVLASAQFGLNIYWAVFGASIASFIGHLLLFLMHLREYARHER